MECHYYPYSPITWNNIVFSIHHQSLGERWGESWARAEAGSSRGRDERGFQQKGVTAVFLQFTILHIIFVSTYVVRVHISSLLRWNRKWKDWDRLKHPWRKELKGSELRFKFFCFSSTQSMLIQVRAAWEDLEARREEFLKEKKVLAHLGFYWASV